MEPRLIDCLRDVPAPVALRAVYQQWLLDLLPTVRQRFASFEAEELLRIPAFQAYYQEQLRNWPGEYQVANTPQAALPTTPISKCDAGCRLSSGFEW